MHPCSQRMAVVIDVPSVSIAPRRLRLCDEERRATQALEQLALDRRAVLDAELAQLEAACSLRCSERVEEAEAEAGRRSEAMTRAEADLAAKLEALHAAQVGDEREGE